MKHKVKYIMGLKQTIQETILDTLGNKFSYTYMNYEPKGFLLYGELYEFNKFKLIITYSRLGIYIRYIYDTMYLDFYVNNPDEINQTIHVIGNSC